MTTVSPLISTISEIIYPTFGNWAIAAACAAILFVSASAYSAEKTGQGGGYSKFAGAGGKAQFSSKWGMFLFYFPSFLLGLYFLVTSIPADLSWANLSTIGTFAESAHLPSVRMTVVSLLMTLHFLKRCLEVLFVHKYSGTMDIDNAFAIPFLYCLFTGSLLSLQQIVTPLPPPEMNLLGAGVLLAVVGNAGNFYHHFLLSKLRKTKSASGKKKYEVPHGGLFEYVACPHYLFEIISFIGYALASQNVVGLCNVVWVVAYLAARSERCAKYYVEKIEDYPRSRKALVPFLF